MPRMRSRLEATASTMRGTSMSFSDQISGRVARPVLARFRKQRISVFALIHDQGAKSLKIGPARGAGVAQQGHPRVDPDFIRGNADPDEARSGMAVNVDQTRRDDLSLRGNDFLGLRLRNVVGHFGDFAVLDRHRGNLVNALGGSTSPCLKRISYLFSLFRESIYLNVA